MALRPSMMVRVFTKLVAQNRVDVDELGPLGDEDDELSVRQGVFDALRESQLYVLCLCVLDRLVVGGEHIGTEAVLLHDGNVERGGSRVRRRTAA